MPKSAEQCEEIRKSTKEMILRKSMIYFAKNGFTGTKIRDLAEYIGIGQGSLYSYFKSKEELFLEILKNVNREDSIKQLKMLKLLPVPAKQKIHILSSKVLQRLEEDDDFAGTIVLNTQMLLEENAIYSSKEYQSELYKYTAKIIKQGQKEGSVVGGSPTKLANYYWGVVFLYALKKIAGTAYEMIDCNDLKRTLFV